MVERKPQSCSGYLCITDSHSGSQQSTLTYTHKHTKVHMKKSIYTIIYYINVGMILHMCEWRWPKVSWLGLLVSSTADLRRRPTTTLSCKPQAAICVEYKFWEGFKTMSRPYWPTNRRPADQNRAWGSEMASKGRTFILHGSFSFYRIMWLSTSILVL